MKSFIFKCAAIAAPVIACAAILTFCVRFPNTRVEEKYEELRERASPKIVLAGGSAMARVTRASALGEAGLPVINSAFTYGYGLGRILDGLSPYLNAGDTLVLAAEYEHFTSVWNGNYRAYQLIFDNRRYDLLFSRWYGLPSDFSLFLSYKLLSIRGRAAPAAPAPAAAAQEITGTRPFLGNHGFGRLDRRSLGRFFGMTEALAKRGVIILISYPSLEEASFRENLPLISGLDAAFRSNKYLNVISRPEDYAMPRALCFDSPYHLNSAGEALRDERLCRDILRFLGRKQP
ncbi:MAG: hypothetical protein LBC77_07460 [Spirochaetaceae bacterium]|nr:hypothetical protein [Spirochaetaceae bacterium]